jgi:hypothetical protein
MLSNPFRIAPVVLLAAALAGFAQTRRVRPPGVPDAPPPDPAATKSAPPCQDRALNTVAQARSSASAGVKDKARKLLEQAEVECGVSPVVQAEIGAVYEQIGDKVLAELYLKNRKANVAKSPAPGAATEPVKGFVREKYAVIVGVGRFQDPKIPTLKYSAKDARDFAAMLTDTGIGRFHPGNVTVLTDGQATTTAVKGALAEVAAKAMREDLVVLYFSTHGSSPSMDKSKVGSGYLITHDTDLGRPLYASAFGMDDLATFMSQKLRAERIVTFLDTCYSGDATRHVNGAKGLEIDSLSEQSIGQIAQGKGSVVITSSDNRELSWESDEKQNSFFTLFLLDSMRGRQGLADVRQLYTDIQRKLPAAVKEYTLKNDRGEKGKGAQQNPQIYPKTNIPDIVIGTPIQ